MQERIAYQGITFDDVLLEPAFSDILPKDVDVRTQFTRNIRLNIPIISSPMDTVTESELAIALAQEGGIGTIHKNMSILDQTREVDKVKRSENGIITDPITLPPDETVGTARRIMEQQNISGVPITVNGFLRGILTRRDLRFLTENTQKLSEVMTKDNLVTAPENTTLEAAERILTENKVEKLLLVDDNYKLKGLITIRDIDKLLNFPSACKDARGRLRVGAAIGMHDYERAESLIRAGVDVLVVDSSHGHTSNVIATVAELKKRHGIEIIAGNVATAEGARALVQAGADAVKVGIGPGSICTTRVISGVGVPQITAVYNAAQGIVGTGVPIVADGGVRYSGDLVKALAAGAHTVMLGGLLAGLAESPGQTIIYKGRTFKTYRGMGSLGAMVTGSSERYRQVEGTQAKLVPEGVEGRVPYKGNLGPFVYQLVGGLRAGMGYCGTRNIEELRTRTRFILVTSASVQESHPHDILITQKRLTTVPGRRWPIRMATSLLGLGLLIHTGSAEAQSNSGQVPKGLPAPATYPVVQPPMLPPVAPPSGLGKQQPSMSIPANSAPVLPEPVQQPAVQPDDRRGPRTPYDASVDYKGFLEVPGIERLTRFETESDLFKRMEQEQMKAGDRIVFPEDKVLAKEPYPGRHWAPKTMGIEPAYVAHERLLFEQENFERGLWDFGVFTLPVCAAEFGWDVVTLPYHIGTRPCQQYDTSAGKCLPGDATPFRISPFEWSLSGAVAETAVVTGIFFIFP